MSRCPQPETWYDLASGSVSDAEMDELWQHLLTCRTCATLAGDLLRAEASVAASMEVPDEVLGRFRARLSAELRQDSEEREPSPILGPILLRLRTWAVGPGLSGPVLVGDAESDARSLQAQLPTFASQDNRVMLRLRKEHSSGRLLAYVIGDVENLGRWCSVLHEPSGRAFLTNGDGFCELAGVSEEELREASFSVRPPSLVLAPSERPHQVDTLEEDSRVITLVQTGQTRLPVDADAAANTATLRIQRADQKGKVDFEVSLSDSILSQLPSEARLTLALILDHSHLHIPITETPTGCIQVGRASLPLSILEFRIFTG